jgi:deoxyribodipyrimidine photo-lyase
MHREVVSYEIKLISQEAYEELRTEKSLAKSLQQDLHLVDGGSTIVHPDDIPFEIGDTPDIFTQFRKQVEGLEKMVRSPTLIDDSTQFPEFPSEARQFRENEEKDLMAHLVDLGDDRSLKGKSAVPFHGSETAALQRVKHYFSESRAVEMYKSSRNGLIGADYSTKFSAFLAHGNISARYIYHLLKQHEEQFLKGRSSKDTYWVVFELLWRDFWKFLVRKTGNQVFKLEGKGYGPGNERKWSTNKEMFNKWKDGITGVPFIDANMREIAATG